jgi:asparagine synthase (glutamine-hydrolysing)
MVATLAHRGPDGDGTWIDDAAGLALGHRRLAILDPSPQGHQPMASRRGRHVLAFNGEIYNHKDIRAALDAEGAAGGWRGGSDTEVMVEAIARWGPERALAAFNGMFAFAVWNRETRTLTLARDRIGEKPLYYGWLGRAFVFASELKALKPFPDWRGEIDRGALALYFQHNYVPAPHTIYQGVAKLQPGHLLTLKPGAEPGIVSYWSARTVAESASGTFAGDHREAADQLDDLLGEVVASRMEADVPLGAFLSGGIDSSLVVAMMRTRSAQPVRTFTIGFANPRFDEAPHARRVAEHLGTQHTEVTATDDDALALVPKLPAIWDEPLADPSCVPTALLCALTRKGVTVSLSGDGGDELFCGYDRYPAADRQWRTARRLPANLRRLLARASAAVPAPALNRLLGPLGVVLSKHRRPSRPGDKLRKLLDAKAAADAEAVFRQHLSQWRDPAALVVGAAPMRTAFDDPARLANPLDRFMVLDAVTYLPDDILVKMDRASMAVGLEARAPLLDHRLVEFAWSLPPDLKLRGGVSKWLPRQVLYRYVPPTLVDRPKMGFGPPIGDWMRGPLRDWAGDLLAADRLRDQGFLNPAPIAERWREHQAGLRDWRDQLWSVVVFQAWLAAQAGM